MDEGMNEWMKEMKEMNVNEMNGMNDMSGMDEKHEIKWNEMKWMKYLIEMNEMYEIHEMNDVRNNKNKSLFGVSRWGHLFSIRKLSKIVENYVATNDFRISLAYSRGSFWASRLCLMIFGPDL